MGSCCSCRSALGLGVVGIHPLHVHPNGSTNHNYEINQHLHQGARGQGALTHGKTGAGVKVQYVVDNFEEEVVGLDARFVHAVWKRRGAMTTEELNELITKHFKEVERLRLVKRANFNKQQDSLLGKIKKRLNKKKTEEGGEEDEGLTEIMEDIERNRHLLSVGCGDDSDGLSDKATSSRPWRKRRLPKSKEELEKLLEENRERRKQHLEREAAKAASHAQKIKEKLAAGRRNRSGNTGEEADECDTDSMCELTSKRSYSSISVGTGDGVAELLEVFTQNVAATVEEEDLMDEFTKDVVKQNEKFTEDFWSRRGNMTVEEFNELMTKHFYEVERLRQVKQAKQNEQHNSLLSKLQERLKNRKTEEGEEEDEELTEIIEDIERNLNLMSVGCGNDDDNDEVTGSGNDLSDKAISTRRWRKDRLPESKEELEKLLEENRERRKRLLEMEAAKAASHAQKVKEKLEAMRRKRPGKTGEEDDEGDSDENVELTGDGVQDLVEDFTKDVLAQDDEFAEDIWKRRENMSVEELNELMTRHFNEVERLRQVKQAANNKQQDSLLSKLQERLKKRTSEERAKEDEEMTEIMEDIERNRNQLSVGCGNHDDEIMGSGNDLADQAISTHPWRKERLPESKEELEKLLEENRERRKRLLAMEAAKAASHAQKIKEKLEAKRRNRTGKTGEEADEEDADENVDPTVDGVQDLVEDFTKDVLAQDDEFAEDIWKRREKMTVEELNELMTKHYNEVERLRQAKQAENNKQQDSLLSKLQERLKKRTTEERAKEDEEMTEIMEDIERNQNLLSVGSGNDNDESMGSGNDLAGKAIQPRLRKPDRLPTSKEEVEQMLAEYKEQRLELLKKAAGKNRLHTQKLKEKLEVMKRKRSENTEQEDEEPQGGNMAIKTPQRALRRRIQQPNNEETVKHALAAIALHDTRRKIIKKTREIQDTELNGKLPQKLKKKLSIKRQSTHLGNDNVVGSIVAPAFGGATGDNIPPKSAEAILNIDPLDKYPAPSPSDWPEMAQAHIVHVEDM